MGSVHGVAESDPTERLSMLAVPCHGTVLGTVGCLSASLVSTQRTPVSRTPLPGCDSQRCLQTSPFVLLGLPGGRWQVRDRAP